MLQDCNSRSRNVYNPECGHGPMCVWEEGGGGTYYYGDLIAEKSPEGGHTPTQEVCAHYRKHFMGANTLNQDVPLNQVVGCKYM